MFNSNDEQQAKDFLNNLKEKLQSNLKRKCVFLLVGRTGVGKSSTVNSLLGQNIAVVGDYEPTTIEIQQYDSEINGVKFTVIDTPGLCDELEEVGNDYKYLELMRSRVNEVDSMWFVSRLDDKRVTNDEKRGIKLISESFTPKIWQYTVIVFTFADALDDSQYSIALEKRTELIRKEIAKYTGVEIAKNVPSVAVSNICETTPDGKKWLGELYTQVYLRMSNNGAAQFFMATLERIKPPEKEKEIVYVPTSPAWIKPPEKEKEIVYVPTSPAWIKPPEKEKEIVYVPTPSAPSPTYGSRIELDDSQVEKVVNRTYEVLDLTAAGATVGALAGSLAGPVGAAVGGIVGATIGFIGGWFSKRK